MSAYNTPPNRLRRTFHQFNPRANQRLFGRAPTTSPLSSVRSNPYTSASASSSWRPSSHGQSYGSYSSPPGRGTATSGSTSFNYSLSSADPITSAAEVLADLAVATPEPPTPVPESSSSASASGSVVISTSVVESEPAVEPARDDLDGIDNDALDQLMESVESNYDAFVANEVNEMIN